MENRMPDPAQRRHHKVVARLSDLGHEVPTPVAARTAELLAHHDEPTEAQIHDALARAETQAAVQRTYS